MAATLRGRLLDAFELSIDGRAVDHSAFERPSGARLLKLLLVTPGHRIRRESAADALWPEADPDRSAANLRKAIHFARRALDPAEGDGPSPIQGEGDSLRFPDDLVLDLDVDRLRTALAQVRDVLPGTGIATGALEILAELAGRELLPEDPYEEWLAPHRERLREQSLDGLVRGAEAARAEGRRDLAFRLVDRILALDAAEEAGHRLAIQLHLDGGHLHAARRQLLACSRALADTYGIEPSADLVELVDAATAARASDPGTVEAEESIIGRRLELEAAEVALDRVANGQLGALAILGSPGIGKTRVLREVVASARASGWQVAEARGLESSPDLALAALGTAIAAALGGRIPAEVDEPGRSALLTIAPVFGERPEVVFASDEALGSALIDAIAAVARRAPLALAMDDLQWLDRRTLDLLGAVVSRLDASPILLLATVRDEPDPVTDAVRSILNAIVRGGGGLTKLGPVAPREVGLILERSLPGARLDPALIDAIWQRAGGAPLYALELLRSMVESQAVIERGGAWRLAAPSVPMPVPPSVQVMVARRTERLPPTVSRVLTLAAELGNEVSLEELTAASPVGGATDASWSFESVLDALDEGITAGLIVERAGRYAFTHPLFRAALRGAVRPRERAGLHLRVAQVLSRGVEPGDADAIAEFEEQGLDVVGVAAHALDAAELGLSDSARLAIGFGFGAGERQAGLFDHAAAAATLERSLALWDRLSPDAARAFPATRASIQLGWSRHAIGDQDGAGRAFRAGVARARDEREAAEAWQAAAWMPYEHGRFETADALLRTALETVVDPVPRASLEADRAWIIGRRGDWAAAYGLLTTAVGVLEQGASPGVLARSLDRLAVAMRDAADPAGSVAVFQRALRLATESRDPRLAATIRMHLAGVYRRIGALDAATEEIDAALHACAMTGDRYIEAVTVWVAAEVQHAAGRYREAITLRRRELELLASLGGNEHNQAMAHAHIAWLADRIGDPGLADTERELARTVARHSGLPHLPDRIEEALGAAAWFIEDAPTRGGNGVGTAAPDHVGS